MAIYQYYIALIPKNGLVKYFGKLPQRLDYDNLTKEEKEGNDEIEDSSDYFELIQHKCWALEKIKPDKFINEIDKKLNRANWGNNATFHNWKTETETQDIDAHLLTDETQQEIIEFNFRVDLRLSNLTFLNNMIGIAKENELILMDIKGNLIKPNFETLLSFIKTSNAYRFVQNPKMFFEDIESGKIEIEGKIPKH
jgi:hypothetical protein